MSGFRNITKHVGIFGAVVHLWPSEYKIFKKFDINIFAVIWMVIYTYYLILNINFVNLPFGVRERVIHFCLEVSEFSILFFLYFNQFSNLHQRRNIKAILQQTNIFFTFYNNKTPTFFTGYVLIIVLLTLYGISDWFIVGISENVKLISYLLTYPMMYYRISQMYVISYLFRLLTNIFKQMNNQIEINKDKMNRLNQVFVLNNIAARHVNMIEILIRVNKLFNPYFLTVSVVITTQSAQYLHFTIQIVEKIFNMELNVININKGVWTIIYISILSAEFIHILQVCANLTAEVSIVCFLFSVYLTVWFLISNISFIIFDRIPAFDFSLPLSLDFFI